MCGHCTFFTPSVKSSELNVLRQGLRTPKEIDFLYHGNLLMKLNDTVALTSFQLLFFEDDHSTNRSRI